MKVKKIRLSTENLNAHKNMIHHILQVLTHNKEEIHIINSEYDILQKEARLWIYDFDTIKINVDLRVSNIKNYLEKTKLY